MRAVVEHVFAHTEVEVLNHLLEPGYDNAAGTGRVDEVPAAHNASQADDHDNRALLGVRLQLQGAADAHHEYRRKRKCVAEGNDGRQDRADVNAPHDSCEAASQFYDRAVGDALDEAALVQRGGHDKTAHQRIRHLLGPAAERHLKRCDAADVIEHRYQHAGYERVEQVEGHRQYHPQCYRQIGAYGYGKYLARRQKEQGYGQREGDDPRGYACLPPVNGDFL